VQYPGFVGPANKSQAVISDCSRLVNLYPEQGGITARASLNAWPGQSQFAALMDIGGRALFQMNNRTLAVMGAGLYGIAADATTTKYGTVTQDANRAYITMNGRSGGQALVASAGDASVLNLTTNVLSAPVLTGAAHQIGMIDGYGVAFDRTLARIRVSDLNDFTTWDPILFQGRNDAPDDWVAMLVSAPDIWLIGGQTGCVWFDAGDFPFPLAPRPGVNFPVGIVASDSIAKAGDSVLWLSSNANGAGVVVRARGYTPQRFSTFAVEAAIARYLRTTRIDDAEGMGIEWQGHNFYILNFPTAGATWAADLETGDWFELSSFAGGVDTVWRSRVHCLSFGKHLVADRQTGVIAYLDVTKGTEADGATQRLIKIPPSLLAANNTRIEVDRFQALVQGGIGAVTGTTPETNPVALLRISHDFGQTWGNELQAAIGPIGATGTEVFWNRLGSSELGWVPELVITDPARPVAIVGGDILGSNLGIGGQGA
jgi:hypothetical protein